MTNRTMDFVISKDNWNERTRRLLDIFHKSYEVFDNGKRTAIVRIHDVTPLYASNGVTTNMVMCQSSVECMILIASLDGCGQVTVGNFAIEKKCDDDRYSSGRVIFVKSKKSISEESLDDIYRPIYPVFDYVKEFYKENKTLIKKVYDDLADGVLQIDQAPYRNSGEDYYPETKVFLSVPISGLPEEIVRKNVGNVKHALHSVLQSGLTVMTPFEICGDETDRPYSWYMGQDIEELLNSHAIISLPGWINSKGCRCERATAEIYGLKIYDADEILKILDSDTLFVLTRSGRVRKLKILERRLDGLMGEFGPLVLNGKELDHVNEDGSIDPMWDGGSNQFVLRPEHLFRKNVCPYTFHASEEDARNYYNNKCSDDDLTFDSFNIYAMSLKDRYKLRLISSDVSMETWRQFAKRLDDGFDSEDYYFIHPTSEPQPILDE